MNDTVIDRWNSIITDQDTVYHLGDFCFGDANKYLSRLRGQLHLIAGNHDRGKTKKHLRWLSVQSYLSIPYDKGQPHILCHCPIEDWAGKDYGAVHLHGHRHGKGRKILGRYDVGVDSWDFTPVTLDQVLGVPIF